MEHAKVLETMMIKAVIDTNESTLGHFALESCYAIERFLFRNVDSGEVGMLVLAKP